MAWSRATKGTWDGKARSGTSPSQVRELVCSPNIDPEDGTGREKTGWTRVQGDVRIREGLTETLVAKLIKMLYI